MTPSATTKGTDLEQNFRILTGSTKALQETGDDGVTRYFLQGTASSTVEDRHGDTILASAQAQMLESARELVMWLNHSYTVPEDILGTCKESSLSTEGEVIDLNIRLEVYPDNPRAMQSWKAVKDGIKLGFSIGGRVTDFEWKNEDDWWDLSMNIAGIDLYEISLVGIPANPRAYVETMAKSVRDCVTRIEPTLLNKSGGVSNRELLKARRDEAKAKVLRSTMQEEDVTTQPASDEPAATPVNTPTKEAGDPGSAPVSTDESAEAQKRLDEATTKAAEAEDKLAALNGEIEKAQQNLTAINADVTAKSAERDALDADLATKRQEATELQRKADELRATPAGRKSVDAAGNSNVMRTIAPYVKTPTHLVERSLSAKLMGVAAGDARTQQA